METAIGSGPFASESPDAMVAFAGRQRGWGGDQAQYDRWMDDWFLPPSDLDGRIWRMQLLQARATTFTYEWLRLHSKRCGGALVWQLNDAWTGHSWSLIDVAGRPKPAWWAARAACAPRLLAFSVGEAGIEIAAINDTDEPWGGASSKGVRIRRIDMAGVDLDAAALELEVPPRDTRATALLPDLVIPADPSMELLLAEFDGHRAFWFYGKDAWLSLPSPVFDLRVDRVAKDGFEVELTARTILRDLHLDEAALGDVVRVDANLHCLLPGDVATFRIDGVSSLQEKDLRRAGVLRTANDCGPAAAAR
jgi:beta-mannosidase